MASPICFRLLAQLIRLAASRARWTAGSMSPIRIEMMAMTTSSSISVKPGRVAGRVTGALLALPVPERAGGDLKADGTVRHPGRGAGQFEPEVLGRVRGGVEPQEPVGRLTGRQAGGLRHLGRGPARVEPGGRDRGAGGVGQFDRRRV